MTDALGGLRVMEPFAAQSGECRMSRVGLGFGNPYENLQLC